MAVTNPVPVEPVVIKSDRLTSCGITWFFDKEYVVGSFINGDPWVQAGTSGQSVTITSIDPPPKRARLKNRRVGGAIREIVDVDVNGTEIDPQYGEHHGFDGGADSRVNFGALTANFNYQGYPGHIKYESGLNVGLNMSYLYADIVVTGKAWGTSVVSVESEPLWEGDKWDSSRISKAGVLTVYDSGTTPSVTAFRPPYCKHPGIFSGKAGTSGVPALYSYDQSSLIDDGSRLGVTGFNTDTNQPNITGVAASFQCLRLDHLGASGWIPGGGDKFVTDQYKIMNKGQVYTDGRDIAVLAGQAALLYHATGLVTSGDVALYDLRVNVAQRAIDLLGICESYYENHHDTGQSGLTGKRYVNSGSDKWGADHGTTNNCGRKMELLLGAYFLSGDSRIRAQGKKLVFQEDEQTFLIDQTTLRVGKNYLSGDIGTAEWGVKHGAGAPGLDNKNWESPGTYDNARADDGASAWWGQEIASRIMSWDTGGGDWEWAAFHTYQGRFNTLQGNNNATQREKAWDTWSYRMWTGNNAHY